ncbi:hypothetical protein CLV58_113129 [Spirosoma oryzae]|uniref:Double-GTPase 1 domain-containing protein n=1 Tax=Spirosoma oryzae TaxID=1469603 RepID=A0A2T0SRH0_9BACT|nr:hypothetical protein [Spirosoma oryzae]PRY35998.1 hypothetical protein CLV58_113129 [Spirosoma oryzae]
MERQKSEHILIIGGPDVGKTHFGGQLYGRLQSRTGSYKITSPPENLTVFKEVLENLNEGRSAGHTNVSANEVLELDLIDDTGRATSLRFPDYGGEQVNSIVIDRRVNKDWTNQLKESTSWMLFIRLDRLPIIEDIINRGLPEQKILEQRSKNETPLKLSSSAFYTELLQILLYAQKIASNRTSQPRLVVSLSCWDLIEEVDQKKIPLEVLKEKAPALYAFIESTWSQNYAVVGLSSTERTLSLTEVDLDFVKRGPEDFGFFISPQGELNKDLTVLIKILLGKH